MALRQAQGERFCGKGPVMTQRPITLVILLILVLLLILYLWGWI
ncbi:hypothetical protein [Sphingosinicella humi]|nr:hypothetical protein [Sphingosinicella humi]